MPHIGSLIKQELEHQERPAKWLAKRLCCDRTNIYKIFLKETIDVQMLMRISIALKHNFLKEYSDLTEKEISELLATKE